MQASTHQLSPIYLHLHHKYAYHFHEVAKEFLLKYNIENRFCYTTIAQSRQLDEDRFEIVRRMDTFMSSKPVYERIIYNRADKTVSGYTFEDPTDKACVEHYTYKQGDGTDAEKTLYNMFSLKETNWIMKLKRIKCHNWGVESMEYLLKKKDQFIEAKD